MFPFWEKVVAPVLEAADVKLLVEIGALRGENTRQILDTVGPAAQLHVIDPVPDFDPDEHAVQFGGQYIFHRDLSVNVLGDLPVMDAALIDGDHNWFTVYHECRLLAEVSASAGALLPVMVFHDVCWPYGRRDLYYNPDDIPAEYRQEWAHRGMLPGVAELVPQNGLNPTMANAVLEGGPRNGVMTAIDDFVAEHPKPLRVLVLPIYFGLAIVVEEERLARQPELAAFLDWLEGLEGKSMLLELAETMRIQAMLFQHSIYFQKEADLEHLARRYLDSLKRELVSELGQPVRADLDAFDEALETMRHGHVLGHVVATGVGGGSVPAVARAYFDAHKQHGRDVWVADRFRSVDIAQVRRNLEHAGLLDGRVHLLEGDPAATLPEAPVDRVAVLHVGAGTGPDVAAVLEAVYPRLAPGGVVVVERASDRAVRASIDAFRAAHGITEAETTVASTATTWRRR
ncbi:MAG TPA: TylF/MycF/NovP-related O-methyltransferase [Acidimicrobiales bacterium]|jgi:precorrin-6B methylase 2|nr:hypothetical protein [Acidimicrobiales bacterium]HMS86914.1 TylF/MycF/NovP-related O-methyltransferase [Acidimicrobiales bacterium]HRA33545.1 TylF/MycF/NovP-related O-methyltransferase [Acidimicrobiales bacterium]